MDRRTYLRTLTVGGTTSLLAGCSGALGGDSSPNTYLPKPEMAKKVDSTDLPYPAWGQPLPAVTLPAPLRDESVTLTQFEGSRTVLLTFFYSHCPKPSPNNAAICRKMIAQMRNVQADAERHGYADRLAFLAVTFDPQRDVADRLRTFAHEMHIDLDAGNWYFLRPESRERADSVVQGTFGIKFSRVTPSQPTATGSRGSDAETTAGRTTTAGYSFRHAAMMFLVDVDGYVERVFRYESRGNPPWQDRRDTVTDLLDREKSASRS
ncbi:MAG: SCO family protein [Haloferacaceae archaeon]